MRAVDHRLKTHPAEFQAVLDGVKPFEFRKDDRGVAVGDWLHLLEWDPKSEHYTGRGVRRRVTYRLEGGRFGVPEGYCVFGLAYP